MKKRERGAGNHPASPFCSYYTCLAMKTMPAMMPTTTRTSMSVIYHLLVLYEEVR